MQPARFERRRRLLWCMIASYVVAIMSTPFKAKSRPEGRLSLTLDTALNRAGLLRMKRMCVAVSLTLFGGALALGTRIRHTVRTMSPTPRVSRIKLMSTRTKAIQKMVR